MIRAETEWIVRKRDGRLAPFEPKLIFRAIRNAFRAELNLADNQPLDSELEKEIVSITDQVSADVSAEASTDAGVTVESIQDMV
ncbi:MAG: ATP cone domain-containing protein, partial [Phycisphaerae bacterium]